MEDSRSQKMVGNKNAEKEITASSFLHIRITPQEKISYVRQAQAEGKKLSVWVLETLNSAVNKAAKGNDDAV